MHSGAVVTGVNGRLKRASVETKADRGIGGVSLATELIDDDDDFQTPAEHFDKVKSIRMQNKSKNNEGDKISKKRNRATEVI